MGTTVKAGFCIGQVFDLFENSQAPLAELGVWDLKAVFQHQELAHVEIVVDFQHGPIFMFEKTACSIGTEELLLEGSTLPGLIFLITVVGRSAA